MRTKEEIEEQLMARLCLNGSTWMKVKNSLVGKELISLAVEGVRFAEETDYMLFDAFDYRTASENQLISMSHTYDIPVTFYKPSTVVVRTTSDGRLIKAFDLCLKIGSVTYYNITPAVTGGEITLYQGTVFKKTTLNSIETIYTKTSDTINGYNIGDVVPDSIYVYDTSNNVIGRYNHLSASPTRVMFKIYTKENGDQMVLIGNGAWAQAATFGYADYLRPGCTQVSFENANLMLGGADESDFTIVSAVEGREHDIDYARAQFEKYYLDRNAVVSKDQIRHYVSAFPEVLDCNVTRSANTTHVYVKPEDKTSTNMTFDRVKAELLLHSELSANYTINYGKIVNVQFIVYGVATDNRGTVMDYINDKYQYDKLEFDELLNLSALETEIYQLTGDRVVVKLAISGDTPVNGYLTAAPEKGTLGVYEGTSYVGFDYSGSIYKPTVSSLEQANNIKNMTLGSVYLLGPGLSNVGFYEKNTGMYYLDNIDIPQFNSAMTVGALAYTARIVAGGAKIVEYYSSDLGLSTVLGGALNGSREYTVSADTFTLGESLVFSDAVGLKVLHSSGSRQGTISFYNQTGEYYSVSINRNMKFNSIAQMNNSYYVLTDNNKILILKDLNTSVENFPIYDYQLPATYLDYTIAFICTTADNHMMAALIDSTSSQYIVLTFSNFTVDYVTNKLKMIGVGTPRYVDCSNATVSCGDNFIDIFNLSHQGHFRCYPNEDPIDLTNMNGCNRGSRFPIGTIAYNQRFIRINNTENYTYNYETTAINELGDSKYVVVSETEPVIFR